MLKVDTLCMQTQEQRLRQIARQLEDISSRVADVHQKLRWSSGIKPQVRSSINSHRQQVANGRTSAIQLANALDTAAAMYIRCEEAAAPDSQGPVGKASGPLSGKIPGASELGTSMSGAISGGKSWRDYLGTFNDVFPYAYTAFSTFGRYAKIGRAVGFGKAVSWWSREVMGLKPGRASTASTFAKRFHNNLTNSTSPYNKMWKEIGKDFTGKNGVGKAVVSYGTVAITGVLNFFDNKDERDQSGGTISTERMVAETVTETAVDVAVGYGASIVVGAAITALTGTVAAPVLVFAASSAAIAVWNKYDMTEKVSDCVLDGVEAVADTAKNVAKSVGKGVKNAGKAVGKWFNKIF